MIPALHIAKLGVGIYELRILNGGQEVTDPTIHASISEALLHVGEDFPQDWAAHIDVHYLDVSLGTQPLDLLRTGAEGLADRLVALAAEVWASEEMRQGAKIKAA